jgi:hypothetical protein
MYQGPVAAAIYWDERMTNHRGSLLRAIPADGETWTTHQAHAITILGWNSKERAFYFTPNLGTGWGRQGFALLRETDFPHVFVNAVGFEHGNKLDAAAIGPRPPGDRDKMRAAAAANVWYNAVGRVSSAKLGGSPINVGETVALTVSAAPAPALAGEKANPATNSPRIERTEEKDRSLFSRCPHRRPGRKR